MGEILELIFLALRNIFRNIRRTSLTLISIVIGFAALACFGGFIEFSFEGLRESTIRTQLGHIQVYKKGYWENRLSDPEAVLIEDSREIVDMISAINGVAAVSERLSFSGLASAGKVTVNVSVTGVDLRSDDYFSDFEILSDGRRLRSTDLDAGIIGAELQRGLGVELGDWVTVLTNSLDGIINAVDFRVVGVVETGSKEYDSVFVKVPIGLAQQAKETDRTERIIILLDETDTLSYLLPEIKAALSQTDRQFDFRRWDELAVFYKAVVKLYTGIFTVFAFIMGIVVMFSVTNTMTMTVLERRSEIGALRAMGARRSTIIAMFFCEGTAIGLIGAALGAGLSVVIALLIDLYGGIPQPPPPGSTRGFPAFLTITPDIFLLCFLMAMLATSISSLYSAIIASRTNIVKALQSS